MGEKILAVSKKYNIGKALLIFALIFSIAVFAVQIVPPFFDMLFCNENAGIETWNEELGQFVTSPGCRAAEPEQKCMSHKGSSSAAEYAYRSLTCDPYTVWISAGIAIGGDLICLLIYAWLRSYEMTVTDKRVYGKAAFGKRVDLPVDLVSSVATMWLKGIAVATSSGRIAFLMIKNQDEIHSCISNLLIERQNNANANSVATPTPVVSNADEMKKYKELLDMGVISQEEFDAKKKQLLGL